MLKIGKLNNLNDIDLANKWSGKYGAFLRDKMNEIKLNVL
jgi:hypothetical protein